MAQRKKDIDQIQNIMLNINDMAKDINQEVYDQGKKLERLDQHVKTAADNIEKANEQLV